MRGHNSFYSLQDLHSANNCSVKDVILYNQSFIQTSKNYYNHILESLLFLTSSMSSHILVKIFNEIIQKVIF